MSISPLNGGTIIQFPHAMPMTLSQLPPMTLNPAAAAAAVHAAAQAQQRLAVTDNTIAKRNATNAQKRANHNAIERARRECLNSKFQELARSIPSLSQVRRPSKSVIVQKSLDYIYTTKQRTASRDRELRSAKNENISLREEVSRLRKSLGMTPLPERQASASPEPEELTTTDGPDTSRTTNYDSSDPTSASSNTSFGDLKRELEEEEMEEEEEEDGGEGGESGEGTTEEPSSDESTAPLTTPTYVAVAPNGTRTIVPTTTMAQMHGFLDYMQADLSNGLSGLGTDFVTSSIAFPGVTQAGQVAVGIDMYNPSLSLATTAAAIASAQATSPNQHIYMPSPSEEVFRINEFMLNGCIDRQVGVNGNTIEPLQIQTPPRQ